MQYQKLDKKNFRENIIYYLGSISIYLALLILCFVPSWDMDIAAQSNFDPLLPCPRFCEYFRLKTYQKLTIL